MAELHPGELQYSSRHSGAAKARRHGEGDTMLLVGDRTRTVRRDEGRRQCPVCRRLTAFAGCEEARYFTLFGVPLLRLRRLADYLQCESCGNSFAPAALAEPAVFACLRRTLVYVMMGYSREDRLDAAAEVFRRLTGVASDPAALRAERVDIARRGCDLFGFLRQRGAWLNDRGRRQLVEAAFLMTYVSCEMQHEDRVRINLIGQALDLPLEVVAAVIDRVRADSYYGIQRKLPVH
jgi:hypothetical protein